MDELRPFLEIAKIDPRDSRYYVIRDNGGGARRTKRFIPLDVFLEAKQLNPGLSPEDFRNLWQVICLPLTSQ